MSPRAWLATRWALGIGIVALMLVGLDVGEVADRIRTANAPLAVAAILGLTAVHALGAATWAILCRLLGGLRIAWLTALRVHYAAQALGGVTPANIGGDAYRVATVRSASAGWGAAVAPVLVQRATSYVALAVLALPAIGLLLGSGLASPILPAALLLCVVAGVIGVIMLAAPSSLGRWLARRRWAGPSDAEGAPMARVPLRGVLIGVVLGLAFHGVSVVLTAALLAAVDPATVTLPALAAIVVARLSLAVPILPSGLGANEAILAILFGSLGLPPEVALAGLLLGRMALVLTTLMGAGLLLLGRPALSAATSRPYPAVRLR